MKLNLENVFDEYPNPFYIVRPIVVDGKSKDFEYVYVNRAFCIFLGRSYEELVGHTFLDNFEKGERVWLELFQSVALDKKHKYVSDVSTMAGKKLFNEAFYVAPDMCGCIIHDFQRIPGSANFGESREVRHRANYDYLTGFYDRYFFKELSKDIADMTNIGITYVDINNLHEINRIYGHEAGDDVIMNVSKLIRFYYTGSKIFRIDGDEFVIVTSGYTKPKFKELSELSKIAFEEEHLAALGSKFYAEIKDFDECIKECRERMAEHKSKMKQNLKGVNA